MNQISRNIPETFDKAIELKSASACDRINQYRIDRADFDSIALEEMIHIRKQ